MSATATTPEPFVDRLKALAKVVDGDRSQYGLQLLRIWGIAPVDQQLLQRVLQILQRPLGSDGSHSVTTGVVDQVARSTHVRA
jgi:hypothetical protein